jgi:hypothetical protein
MSEEKKDLVVFLDAIGRTIIGERYEETESALKVQNLAVVNVVPQQVNDPNTGQQTQRMALQLFPVFFREFLADKDQAVKFVFSKNNITMSDGDIILDYKVAIQYEQLFYPQPQVQETQPQVQPSSPADDNVIKLFDD